MFAGQVLPLWGASHRCAQEEARRWALLKTMERVLGCQLRCGWKELFTFRGAKIKAEEKSG